MVKVIGPLHSDKASGKFAKNLGFVCGKFVRQIKANEKRESSGPQNFQRLKFINGANEWSKNLTDEQREAWESFSKGVFKKTGCYNINLFGNVISVCPYRNDEYSHCLETANWTGYQYFQSAFLRYGTNGWVGYPYPPNIG